MSSPSGSASPRHRRHGVSRPPRTASGAALREGTTFSWRTACVSRRGDPLPAGLRRPFAYYRLKPAGRGSTSRLTPAVRLLHLDRVARRGSVTLCLRKARQPRPRPFVTFLEPLSLDRRGAGA